MSSELGQTSLKVKYQVVHQLPGRIRIRIPLLRTDATYRDRLKQQVESLNFVTGIRLNSAAKSIAIQYNKQAFTEALVQEKLATVIQQAAQPEQSLVTSSASPSEPDKQLILHPLPHSSKSEPIAVSIPDSQIQAASDLSVSVSDDLPPISEQIPVQGDAIEAGCSQIVNGSINQPHIEQRIEQTIVDPVKIKDNSWLEEWESQVKLIEQLQEQLAQYQSTAALGEAWLRKGHPHNLANIDFSGGRVNVPSELPKDEIEWQSIAPKQAEAIALLKQEIAQQQRLATIGEARLNKWRRHHFFG